jgi:hypothetical protein
MQIVVCLVIVTFILSVLSPLVLICAEGNGYINNGKSWMDIIDPRLQASYEAYEKEKQEKAKFSKDIAKLATLTKNKLNLAVLIHQYDLKGPHYDPDKFDEYTKWMRIYEKETSIAMANYDAAAYVFFFEEFVKLTFKRAGMINPNCKIKKCECRDFNH